MGLYGMFMIFIEDSWSQDAFSLIPLPTNYRYQLFGIFVVNSACSYLFEKYVITFISKRHN